MGSRSGSAALCAVTGLHYAGFRINFERLWPLDFERMIVRYGPVTALCTSRSETRQFHPDLVPLTPRRLSVQISVPATPRLEVRHSQQLFHRFPSPVPASERHAWKEFRRVFEHGSPR
jgi:hypothetical protein